MNDEDSLQTILLVLLALVVLCVLLSGCASLALPGIDNHRGIFSAPRTAGY